MKVERPSFHAGRKEQRMRQVREDSYRPTTKLADPARCPRCGAAYLKGRWSWLPAPASAAAHKCPACRRIEDNFPAGFVTLTGPFFAAHRDEVLNLVSAREGRARLEHPMQRIIGVEPVDGGVVVTTTDAHLARGIAVALLGAFKGDLHLHFNRDQNLVRATWSR
jgi:hypothetical protein